MPTIVKRTFFSKPAQKVWPNVKKVAQLYDGLAVDVSQFDERSCIFHHELTAASTLSERIIEINDVSMRLAFTVRDSPLEHYGVSMQVIAVDDRRCEFVWTTDFLPSEAAPTISAAIELAWNNLSKVILF
jgi:hypothetical protein